MQLPSKCGLETVELKQQLRYQQLIVQHDFVEDLIHQAERNHILFQTLIIVIT